MNATGALGPAIRNELLFRKHTVRELADPPAAPSLCAQCDVLVLIVDRDLPDTAGNGGGSPMPLGTAAARGARASAVLSAVAAPTATVRRVVLVTSALAIYEGHEGGGRVDIGATPKPRSAAAAAHRSPR